MDQFEESAKTVPGEGGAEGSLKTLSAWRIYFNDCVMTSILGSARSSSSDDTEQEQNNHNHDHMKELVPTSLDALVPFHSLLDD